MTFHQNAIIMDILPPSQMIEYPTRQALVDAFQAHAMTQGYAVTIRHSCNRGGLAIVWHVWARWNTGLLYLMRTISLLSIPIHLIAHLVGLPFSLAGLPFSPVGLPFSPVGILVPLYY